MPIKARNSSFELLRILSIIMIVMMHSCVSIDYAASSTFNKIILILVNAVGDIGVSCFVLISGYFGVTFNRDKFIYLILSTTLYSLIVSLINNGINPTELLKTVFVVPRYQIWFVTCYLFLMVLSPYINRFAESLDKADYKNLLGLLILLLSIVPTLFVNGTQSSVLQQGGKNLSYFIFLYLIGRYIRLHGDIQYNRWTLWSIHLGATLIMSTLTFCAGMVTGHRYSLFTYDCNPLILLSAVSIFYLFKSFDFHCPAINYVAASVFAFYILSGIGQRLDMEYFHLTAYTAKNCFVFVLIAEVLFIGIFSISIDKTLGWLLRKIGGG